MKFSFIMHAFSFIMQPSYAAKLHLPLFRRWTKAFTPSTLYPIYAAKEWYVSWYVSRETL